MITITEDYVSYEVAKLLKEKGFDERCEYCYAYFDDNDIRVFELRPNKNAQNLAENRYPYVTHQMAMKWLREVHNKHCDIGYDIDLNWFFQIIDLKETVEYDYLETKYYHTENESGFNSYEDAIEAALKYVLENLITFKINEES